MQEQEEKATALQTIGSAGPCHGSGGYTVVNIPAQHENMTKTETSDK